MFLLYAVDAALVDLLDQVFNQRLVRHDNHGHALFNASRQHEQQALAPSCQKHYDKRRLIVEHRVQRLFLLSRLEADVLLAQHLLQRLVYCLSPRILYLDTLFLWQYYKP
jgi:hypothetical protein